MNAQPAMRFILSLSALALGLVPLVQAQAIPAKVDAAFAAYAALPSQLVPILSGVTDKASADTAAPRLQAALPSVYDARTALHHIPTLSQQETQLVQLKYEKQLRQEWGKLFEQIYRLQRQQSYGSIAFFKQFQTLCLMLEK